MTLCFTKKKKKISILYFKLKKKKVCIKIEKIKIKSVVFRVELKQYCFILELILFCKIPVICFR